MSICNDAIGGIKDAANAVDDAATSVFTPEVKNVPLNGAKWVMNGKHGAMPAKLKDKPAAFEACRHAPSEQKDQVERAKAAGAFLDAAGKYAMHGPRVGDGAGAPKPAKPETSAEKNARMHCIGNVASDAVSHAAAGATAGGAACTLFPLTAPVAGPCASIGAALGGAAGANKALQTPACKQTFNQP